MKQDVTTLDQAHFSIILQILVQGKKGGRTFGRRFKQFIFSKDLLLQGVASLGIGTILLLSIYLFLTQLAEYGW